jgi:DNA-binding beta-propeller fold protein YncE
MIRIATACTLFSFVFLSTAVRAVDAPLPYHLSKTIPLGDGERWDYATFDAAASRVYVAHGDHVAVVDPGNGAVIGTIGPIPGGTHGTVVATRAGVGFTDDGKDGTISVFDPKRLAILKTIKTEPGADGMEFDSASGHVFVINGDAKKIPVIDPAKKSVIATIAVGAELEAAVADGSGKLFVDGVEDHDMIVIDTRSNSVLKHFPMPACERPHGIAIDPKTHRVFATCANKVMVVLDADTGRNITTLPIGAMNDGAVFDPVRKRVISANGEGTLTIVAEKDADHFDVIATVPTLRSARTIAIDAATGRLFLPAADVDSVLPPSSPEGRPRVTYKKGSAKLLVFEPGDR